MLHSPSSLKKQLNKPGIKQEMQREFLLGTSSKAVTRGTGNKMGG